MNIHTVCVNIIHVLKNTAAFLTKIHNIAHVFLRGIDMGIGDRFLRLRYQRWVRIIGRVVDRDHLSVRLCDMVDNAWRSRNNVQIVFPFQALLDNLHMQKPQKTTAESKAQRDGGLRLKGERRVVELQFLQRIPQIRIFRSIRGIDPTEHHGLYCTVSRQWLLCRIVRPGNGVPDTRFTDRLDRCRNITNLACAQTVHRFKTGGAHVAAFHYRKLTAYTHHTDGIAGVNRPILDAHMRDDALIGIVVGIEDQCAQRGVFLALGRWNLLDDLFHHRADIGPHLCRNTRSLIRWNTDHVLNLLPHMFWLGTR